MADVEAHVPRAILGEDLESSIMNLMDLATEAGLQLRDVAGSEGKSVTPFPGAREELERQLRATFEDEIVAVSQSQSGGIEELEVQREIAKKALVGLKLATLKKIARENGALIGGNLEDLATRVARLYDWDQRQIAKLILANEEEPSIERAHIARLFPLEGGYDLDEARERLDVVTGRYIRIGVARWFLFQQLRERPDALEVSGVFKTYQASVDAVSDVASLSALPHDADAHIILDGSPVLQISEASATPSKAAVLAFGIISGTQSKGYIPLADMNSEAARSSLHPTSELLLDVIFNRIMKSELRDVNLTVARFSVTDRTEFSSVGLVGERRPELKAVRFEGAHLLDSIDTCRLLTLDRRPLVEVSFQTSVRGEAGHVKGRFPVRLSVEKDHIAVQTGLGSGEHELSLSVHKKVIEAVRANLENGTLDSDRIDQLFDRMQARAYAQQPPEKADILGADEDGSYSVESVGAESAVDW